MLQNIKNFDIFGKEIKFEVKRSDKFKTVLGGFVTIFLFGIFLLRFILYFDELLNKSKPDIFLSQSFLKDSEIYNFNEVDDFIFSIGLFDDEEGKFVNISQSFSINILKEGDNSTYDLKMESCEKKIIKEKSIVYHPDLKDFYCPNLAENNYNLTIRDKKRVEGSLIIEIFLKDNQSFIFNDTNKERYEIAFGYKRVLFNPEDYLNPFKEKIDYKYFPLVLGRIKEYNIILDKYIIDSDDNPFYEVSN
jgi:hypothetical protein